MVKQSLNPSETDYDDKFNRIAKQEEKGTFDSIVKNYKKTADSSQENINIKNARDSDSNPSTTWKNNVKSELKDAALQAAGVGTKKPKGKIGVLLSVIALLLGAGGLSISGLLTTALVNIKENINNKVDTLSSSIEERQGILLKDKLFNTSTTCVIKIKCRYVGITQFMMDRLNAEGARLVDADGNPAKKNILGKYSGTTLVLASGEAVNASNYTAKRLESKELRALTKIVLKPRVLAWNDATAKKIREAKRIGQNPDLGTDEKSRRTSIFKQVSGAAEVIAGVSEPSNAGADGTVDESGNPVAPTDTGTAAEDINADGAELAEEALSGAEVEPLSNDLGEVINKEPYTGRFSGGKLFQGLASLVNPAGPVSDMCTVYQLTDAITKLSRVTVLLQAMRYAAMFMAMADKLKAGDITSDELEVIMNILTKPDAVGDAFGESFSWQQITGKSDLLPSKPLTVSAAGNPIIQMLSESLKTVRNLVGGPLAIKTTCFIADALTLTAFIPVVGQVAKGLSAAISAAKIVSKEAESTIIRELVQTAIKGVVSKVGSREALKESAISLAKSVRSLAKNPASAIFLATYLAERYAVPYAAQQIAGTMFSADTDGVMALDGIKTGQDAQMAESERISGYKPTTDIDKATAALAKNKASTDEYIASEKANANPLDSNNPYSFVSTLSTTSLPFISKLTTVSSDFSSILSLPSSLFSIARSSLLGQTVGAQTSTEEDLKAELSYCQDDTVLENIVKLPNCIPLYIPPDGLSRDGAAIADQMVASGLLSSSGRPKGNYATRVDKCMSPDSSILDEDVIDNCYGTNYTDSTEADLTGLYALDQRVLDGIDGEEWVIKDDYVLPLDPGYRLNDGFGPRDCSDGVSSCWHKAQDFGASLFAPVYAVASGTVVASGKGGVGGAGVRCGGGESSGTNNNIVSIQQEDGTVASYYHMGGADITVSVGDQVNAGDTIGKVNNCGQSTGPHLHFEVKATGVTDPAILALPRGAPSPYGRNEFVNPGMYLALYGVTI